MPRQDTVASPPATRHDLATISTATCPICAPHTPFAAAPPCPTLPNLHDRLHVHATICRIAAPPLCRQVQFEAATSLTLGEDWAYEFASELSRGAGWVFFCVCVYTCLAAAACAADCNTLYSRLPPWWLSADPDYSLAK